MPSLPEMTAQWQHLNWQPTPEQTAQFQHLYNLVLQGNQQLNLTRITEPEEFWEKHLWDSLRGIAQFLQPEASKDELDLSPSLGSPTSSDFGVSAQLIAQESPSPRSPFRAIDIGTGAGFPGIPIAIVQPTWRMTLLDSTRKKMQFLDGLLETLGLENARTLIDRVESIGQYPRHRQKYDLALVRAVASATVAAEYALPLLKVGGLAVLYRGQWTAEEGEALNWAVQQLGGTIAEIEAFKTPLTQAERHCLYLRKVAPTPAEYPRAIGVPTQSPLA